MKDIHPIELTTHLLLNPVPFVGQRAFKLVKAFFNPLEMYYTFDIPQEDQSLLESYPSIREEIEKVYSLELGTRSWWSPLKYYCEDERAHFELAMKFILDYEAKYPNPNHVDYPLRLKYPTTNPDMVTNIGSIGFRPEMWFEASELACLRAYIDGFFFFKDLMKFPYSDFEIKLLEFIAPYKSEANEGFKTWDRNYRWNWDFDVYGSNERHAIPRFMADIEEYTGTELTVNINNTVVRPD